MCLLLKRVHDKKGFIAFEHIVFFSVLISIALLFLISIMQFYRQENQAIQRLKKINHALNLVVSRKQSHTEVKIDEKLFIKMAK